MSDLATARQHALLLGGEGFSAAQGRLTNDDLVSDDLLTRAMAASGGDVRFGNALLSIAGSPQLYAFDTEAIYSNPGEYTAIVSGMARITSGVFTPEGLRDAFDPAHARATVDFRWRDRAHQLSLVIDDDWADVAGLVAQLNAALAAQGADQRFHALCYPSQMASIVFVSDAARHRLEQAGTLAFEEPGAAAERGRRFEAAVAARVMTSRFEWEPTANPEADRLVGEGSVHLSFGVWNRALDSFERALRLAPDHAGAARGITLAHNLMEDDVERFVEPPRRAPPDLIREAEQLVVAGRLDEAADLLADAAEQVLACGEPAMYVKITDRLLTLRPGHRIALAAARQRVAQGDPRRALTILSPRFKQAPNDPTTLALIAEIFVTLRAVDKAVTVFHQLATVQAQNGAGDQAEATLRRILELKPDDPTARARLHRA